MAGRPGNRRNALFQQHLFDTLDALELYKIGAEDIGQHVKNLRSQFLAEEIPSSHVVGAIEALVRREFSRNRQLDDAHVKVEEFAFEDDGVQLLRILLSITDVRAATPWVPKHVWLGIPCA